MESAKGLNRRTGEQSLDSLRSLGARRPQVSCLAAIPAGVTEKAPASCHLFTCSNAHLLYFSPCGRKIGATGFEPATCPKGRSNPSRPTLRRGCRPGVSSLRLLRRTSGRALSSWRRTDPDAVRGTPDSMVLAWPYTPSPTDRYAGSGVGANCWYARRIGSRPATTGVCRRSSTNRGSGI